MRNSRNVFVALVLFTSACAAESAPDNAAGSVKKAPIDAPKKSDAVKLPPKDQAVKPATKDQIDPKIVATKIAPINDKGQPGPVNLSVFKKALPDGTPIDAVFLHRPRSSQNQLFLARRFTQNGITKTRYNRLQQRDGFVYLDVKSLDQVDCMMMQCESCELDTAGPTGTLYCGCASTDYGDCAEPDTSPTELTDLFL
jgi:hypothetical protein